MGDVVHATAAANDIKRHLPDAEIHWLVEAPFAAIPQMLPAVTTVLPMAWRKWRSQLLQRATWKAMGELRRDLQRANYDVVLDLQGLIKSALWARQTGSPIAGFDEHSAREPQAAWFYKFKGAVPRDMQAVERCRRLAAVTLGYPMPEDPPDFGLRPPAATWRPRGAYAVLIPNASRKEKLWPERFWVAVGKRLKDVGWTPLVLWGRPEEQSQAESIAAGCEGDVPPFLRVGEMAAVLAGAQTVVGLDTGFTHLAAAIGKPTLGIYCDHEPGRAGITGPGRVASIGGKGIVPTRNDVLALLEQQLTR